MRASVIINNVEFGEYLAEDGFQLSPISRAEKSLVTADGTLFKHEVVKHQLDLTLLDMSDAQFKVLTDAIATANPATVSYSDFQTGTSQSGVTFYVNTPTVTAKKSIQAGMSGSTKLYLTYLTSLTLTLEEK